MKQDMDNLLVRIRQGVGNNSVDQANDLLAQCYNAITDLMDLIPPEPKAGKWGMSRLWRAWMATTAEWMAANGSKMPLALKPDGTYKNTRPFNEEDAHELFSRVHLGTDSHGNRYSWAKQAAPGEVIADKGQRFHALQQHQIWMTERGIKHINPRESEYQSLLAMAEGQA